MKKVNVIIIYHPDGERLLVCQRTKSPYAGKFNFVGGKVEPGESEMDAAYRELFEETGISRRDVRLTHIMNFQYLISDVELEVFAGKLQREIALKKEINPLLWINRSENFCDMNRFAGDCNMEHMLRQVELAWQSKSVETPLKSSKSIATI